jgi:hypothetical protein
MKNSAFGSAVHILSFFLFNFRMLRGWKRVENTGGDASGYTAQSYCNCPLFPTFERRVYSLHYPNFEDKCNHKTSSLAKFQFTIKVDKRFHQNF